jgi:predicted DNA-binding transcriptional regulator YafY
VYSQAGRGGGWSLVGGARTDLSGLSAAEARTLFLVAGPSAAATPQIKAALRKLVRALPEPLRAEAESAASAVVLDPDRWDRASRPEPEHLEVLQRAVVDAVQVRVRYAGRDRPETERLVHPLGLVAKASVWYLVAGTEAGLRTFRLSRVRGVVVTDEPAERPEGFDLAETWREIVGSIDERRTWFEATALVDPAAVSWLRAMYGNRITVGKAGRDGRVRCELRSWSAHTLASELASFGARVEVVTPHGVRDELARLGAELVARYGQREAAPHR